MQYILLLRFVVVLVILNPIKASDESHRAICLATVSLM